MSEFIQSITIEAALSVASNLLPDDRKEVKEGWGADPLQYLLLEAAKAECICFKSPSGRIAGMAGVEKEDGRIWMLCTDVIHEHPLIFAREAKRWIESREEKLLWNVVDKRNKVHLKLLQFLGFKFLREFTYGPNKTTFIEFCRLCVDQ